MGGLLQKQYQDEDAAREHLGRLLWCNGPVCPHRGVIENIYKLESKPSTKAENRMRKDFYKCRGWRKQFTVTVGTIFRFTHPFA